MLLHYGGGASLDFIQPAPLGGHVSLRRGQLVAETTHRGRRHGLDHDGVFVSLTNGLPSSVSVLGDRLSLLTIRRLLHGSERGGHFGVDVGKALGVPPGQPFESFPPRRLGFLQRSGQVAFGDRERGVEIVIDPAFEGFGRLDGEGFEGANRRPLQLGEFDRVRFRVGD